MSRTITLQSNSSYHKYRTTHFCISLRKILTKSMERDMQVKGIGSRCVLAELVKDNYYAMYDNPSYYKYRETHFSILLDVKFWQSQ